MQVGIADGLQLVLEPRVQLADARLIPVARGARRACRVVAADLPGDELGAVLKRPWVPSDFTLKILVATEQILLVRVGSRRGRLLAAISYHSSKAKLENRKSLMPRKPFLGFYQPGMDYAIGPDAIAKRPELAALVGRCIAIWSDVELQMALSLEPF